MNTPGQKNTESDTALLHYWLQKMRGGEMVLKELCRLFPSADIFTHAAIRENLDPVIRQHTIHESLISHFPFGRKHCQAYLPLMPFAQKQWDFSRYKLLISSESGPVKGIRKPCGSRHICYCHTPMRYLWDMYDDYYEHSGFVQKCAMRLTRDYLRSYDLKSAECVDTFLANSSFVAERIKRIYNREATVVYPPVDVEFFGGNKARERKFYLFAGAFVYYKRPELVLETFRRLPNERLVMAGDGELFDTLRNHAPANTTFVRQPDRIRLRELYASAKALLFPGVEDFGIIPVEAQAAGCPVIAMNYGGTAESVLHKKTGWLMKKQDVNTMLGAIEEMRSMPDLSSFCRDNVKRFSAEKFRNRIMEVIGKSDG